MVSHKIIIKFSIVTLLSFLMITTSSSGLYQDKSQVKSRQEPVPHIEGIQGNNSWYISDVLISFSYDPSLVSLIFYFLDGEWYLYEEPFTVSNDGLYLISWLWYDMSGGENEGQAIGLKIDQTPPSVQLTRKSGGNNKMIFTAEATDITSGMERVEFYLNDVLQQTINTLPYEYTWTGEEKQWVYVIGYDNAGNSEKSKNISTPRPFFINNYMMQRFFSFIQMILLRYQK